MNFAEAALLIQGTSMIYSRKVEYLYALVFQTLAHLSKQQDDGRGRQRGENDPERADGIETDDEDGGGLASGASHLDLLANPLPVVEHVEEARHITLKKRDTSHNSQVRNISLRNNMQASIALMGPLLPDERDHGDTFKLLSCNLHPSGVLLLDEASKKYLEPMDETLAISTSQQSRTDRTATTLNFDGVRDDATDFHHGDDDDDNDDDVDDNNDFDEQPVSTEESAGFEYGGGDAYENEEQTSDPVAEDPFLADSSSYQDAIQSHAPLSSSVQASPAGPTSSRKKLEALKDPWAPLDPYDASKSTVKPFVKGRSYSKKRAAQLEQQRLKQQIKKEEPEMDGVDDPAFKDRFLLRANRPQWSTWVWTELDERKLEAKLRKKYCKAPCLMKSCDSLWRMETKWKALLKRSIAAEAQSAQAILLQEQAEEEEQQLHAMASRATGGDLLDDPLFAGGGGNDMDTMAVDTVDSGGADDDDDDDDGGDIVDMGGFDGGYDDAGVEFGDAAAAWRAPAGGAADDGERPLSYEEICRQHLEAFMRGTEQYIRETDLTRQVNDWQDKLTPILKEQDRHPPFDIHRYGQSILENLEMETSSQKTTTKKKAKKPPTDEQDDDQDADARPTVPFDALVGGLQQFEVCRMFLASLQLANNGNVHLVHAHEAAEQDAVPFQMQLLSTANVYEAIQTS
ncbi:hypothetical protein PINS_up007616 [Pythium insidiosum]|nr:hypothetical protein PINS_up007616 [Pythium insidiosum]